MAHQNALWQEKTSILARIDPQTVNAGAGTVTSNAWDAQQAEQAGIEVNINSAASADVVITINQSQQSDMSNPKLLASYTVAAADVPTTKSVKMTIRGQDFDANALYRYAQVSLAHADAGGGPMNAVVHGSDGPYEPQSNNDLSGTVNVPYPIP